MKTRKEISQELKISEQYLSMLFNGKKKISWPLAEKLAKWFPGRSISEWKRATPEDLRRAFEQLKTKEAA